MREAGRLRNYLRETRQLLSSPTVFAAVVEERFNRIKHWAGTN